MSHHLLPGMGREWLDAMTHAFLIRDPRAMVASLGEKLGAFDLLATGLPQQVEIFEHVVERTGRTPPVVDAEELLQRPEPMLRALCAALGVPFSRRACLRGRPGGATRTASGRGTGMTRVERSTGFEAPRAERRTRSRCRRTSRRSRPSAVRCTSACAQHRLRA